MYAHTCLFTETIVVFVLVYLSNSFLAYMLIYCTNSCDMIMLCCWWKDPDDRPTFSDLESDLSNFLLLVAGYLDFNEFALDVPPDSYKEANGLSVVAGERNCAELARQQVISVELEEAIQCNQHIYISCALKVSLFHRFMSVILAEVGF